MGGGEALFPLADQVFPVLTAFMTKPPESIVSEPMLPEAVAAKTPEQIAKGERAVRLAKALRDNLRRRKVAAPVRIKPRN